MAVRPGVSGVSLRIDPVQAGGGREAAELVAVLALAGVTLAPTPWTAPLAVVLLLAVPGLVLRGLLPQPGELPGGSVWPLRACWSLAYWTLVLLALGMAGLDLSGSGAVLAALAPLLAVAGWRFVVSSPLLGGRGRGPLTGRGRGPLTGRVRG